MLSEEPRQRAVKASSDTAGLAVQASKEAGEWALEVSQQASRRALEQGGVLVQDTGRWAQERGSLLAKEAVMASAALASDMMRAAGTSVRTGAEFVQASVRDA